MIDLIYDDSVYVFARKDETETVIVAINRGDKDRRVLLPFRTFTELIGKVKTSMDLNWLSLPANSAVAFKAS